VPRALSGRPWHRRRVSPPLGHEPCRGSSRNDVLCRYPPRTPLDPSIRSLFVNLVELETKPLDELQDLARGLGLTLPVNVRKSELVFRVAQAQAEQQGNHFAQGVLDIVEDGYGFLRQERFLPGPNDVYVSQSQIRRFALRTG